MSQNPGFENTHKFYEYTADEVQSKYYKKMMIRKKLHSTPKMNGAFADYDSGNMTHLWNTPH